MSWGPEEAAVFLDLVSIQFPLCMVEFQLALVDAVMNCVDRRWFLEVFLSPCSDVHYRIMSVFNAGSSEGLKITTIQYWFAASSLVFRDFFTFSESFNDIMNCRR